MEFIKDNKDNPFFLYFATNDAHVPRFPHERFRGKSKMGLRGDAIVQFDWSVGEIIKTLKEMGVYENTIIILSSDNGGVIDDGYIDQAEELLQGHRPAGEYRGMKYSSFDGGTGIPFIVSWPKEIKKNQKSDALVSQVDFLASFADFLNVRIPKGAAPDSQNQMASWLGKDKVGRSYIVQQAGSLTIRTPEWKYIEPNDGVAKMSYGPKVELGNLPAPQLYQVSIDKSEQNNVAKENPEKVYELQNILRKERARR